MSRYASVHNCSRFVFTSIIPLIETSSLSLRLTLPPLKAISSFSPSIQQASLENETRGLRGSPAGPDPDVNRSGTPAESLIPLLLPGVPVRHPGRNVYRWRRKGGLWR